MWAFVNVKEQVGYLQQTVALDSKGEEREDRREVVSKAILKPSRTNIKPLSFTWSYWDPLLQISSYGSAHMASYVTWILSVAVGSFGRHSILLVPPAPLGLHSNLDFTFVATHSFLRGSTMKVLELCSTVCDLRAFLEQTRRTLDSYIQLPVTPSALGRKQCWVLLLGQDACWPT